MIVRSLSFDDINKPLYLVKTHMHFESYRMFFIALIVGGQLVDKTGGGVVYYCKP